jgi:glycerol-3-phosphate dehydrogenase
VFAGLRPLVKATSKKTAELSRDHLITISESGLITITGGKWTTYRRMAEDVINTAIKNASLENKPCVTPELPVHGAKETSDFNAPLYYYGSDIEGIQKLVKEKKSLGEQLHPRLPYIGAEIIWAVREEMCLTVEDVLSRRTRALLLDAQAAIDIAPAVATLMAEEMQKDEQWKENQLTDFYALAKNYLP